MCISLRACGCEPVGKINMSPIHMLNFFCNNFESEKARLHDIVGGVQNLSHLEFAKGCASACQLKAAKEQAEAERAAEAQAEAEVVACVAGGLDHVERPARAGDDIAITDQHIRLEAEIVG